MMHWNCIATHLIVKYLHSHYTHKKKNNNINQKYGHLQLHIFLLLPITSNKIWNSKREKILGTFYVKKEIIFIKLYSITT